MFQVFQASIGGRQSSETEILDFPSMNTFIINIDRTKIISRIRMRVQNYEIGQRTSFMGMQIFDTNNNMIVDEMWRTYGSGDQESWEE